MYIIILSNFVFLLVSPIMADYIRACPPVNENITCSCYELKVYCWGISDMSQLLIYLEKPRHLSQIQISYCHLKSLPKQSFGKVKVKEIIIEMSPIEDIHDESFDGVEPSSLRELRISHTLISTIPMAIFAYTPDLRYLFIDYNVITHIPNNAFKKLTKLRGLGLAENLIKTVGDQTFKELQSGLIDFIDIHGNPFICDEKLFPFISVLKEMEEQGHIINQFLTKCASPSELLDIPVMNLKVSQSDNYSGAKTLKSENSQELILLNRLRSLSTLIPSIANSNKYQPSKAPEIE